MADVEVRSSEGVHNMRASSAHPSHCPKRKERNQSIDADMTTIGKLQKLFWLNVQHHAALALSVGELRGRAAVGQVLVSHVADRRVIHGKLMSRSNNASIDRGYLFVCSFVRSFVCRRKPMVTRCSGLTPFQHECTLSRESKRVCLAGREGTQQTNELTSARPLGASRCATSMSMRLALIDSVIDRIRVVVSGFPMANMKVRLEE